MTNAVENILKINVVESHRAPGTGKLGGKRTNSSLELMLLSGESKETSKPKALRWNTMKEINDDAKVLVLRMRHTKTLDVTGYKQIKNIALSCKSRNMTLIISELQEQPKKVMRLMGFIDTLGEDHFATNFDEALEKANSLI